MSVDKVGQIVGDYVLLQACPMRQKDPSPRVYIAQHVTTGRTIAVKVAKPGMHDRLLKEATTLNLLSHPNIVQYFGCGTLEDHTPCLLMEYCPYSLRDILWSSLPNAPYKWIIQIGHALQYIINNGLLHLDINLGNILIRPDGNACLSDFELCRPLLIPGGVIQNMQGDLEGTAETMAPEHRAGQPVPASELYALAVVLYTLLVGDFPFLGRPNDRLAIAYQHLNDPPPIMPLIDARIERIIFKALEKVPANRYPDIEIFLGVLTEAYSAIQLEARLAKRLGERVEG